LCPPFPSPEKERRCDTQREERRSLEFLCEKHRENIQKFCQKNGNIRNTKSAHPSPPREKKWKKGNAMTSGVVFATTMLYKKRNYSNASLNNKNKTRLFFK